MSEFTTIATYPQSILAHAAKNFLEEHGIRAFVADDSRPTKAGRTTSKPSFR